MALFVTHCARNCSRSPEWMAKFKEAAAGATRRMLQCQGECLSRGTVMIVAKQEDTFLRQESSAALNQMKQVIKARIRQGYFESLGYQILLGGR